MSGLSPEIVHSLYLFSWPWFNKPSLRNLQLLTLSNSSSSESERQMVYRKVMGQSTSRVFICPKTHFNNSSPQRPKGKKKKKEKKEVLLLVLLLVWDHKAQIQISIAGLGFFCLDSQDTQIFTFTLGWSLCIFHSNLTFTPVSSRTTITTAQLHCHGMPVWLMLLSTAAFSLWRPGLKFTSNLILEGKTYLLPLLKLRKL